MYVSVCLSVSATIHPSIRSFVRSLVPVGQSDTDSPSRRNNDNGSNNVLGDDDADSDDDKVVAGRRPTDRPASQPAGSETKPHRP